jgi:hypothetical protein
LRSAPRLICRPSICRVKLPMPDMITHLSPASPASATVSSPYGVSDRHLSGLTCGTGSTTARS